MPPSAGEAFEIIVAGFSGTITFSFITGGAFLSLSAGGASEIIVVVFSGTITFSFMGRAGRFCPHPQAGRLKI